MNLLDKIKDWFKCAWSMLLDFKDWHEDITEDYADKWGVYNIAWIGFIKGILLVLLLQWIF
tara:strand:+ start:32 stop:214 length:183 start_codon:yes stop_codon:yes gene_type:complete